MRMGEREIRSMLRTLLNNPGELVQMQVHIDFVVCPGVAQVWPSLQHE